MIDYHVPSLWRRISNYNSNHTITSQEYDRVFMNLLLKKNKVTIVAIDGHLMKIATPMWERNITNLTQAVAPMWKKHTQLEKNNTTTSWKETQEEQCKKSNTRRAHNQEKKQKHNERKKSSARRAMLEKHNWEKKNLTL